MAAEATTRPFALFEWMMAMRYLSGQKSGLVSVIAAISFLGITLGVAALIIVMSALNGLHHEMISKILGLNGHMIIRPIGREFTDYAETSERLKKVPGVKHAIPMVEGQVLISSASGASGIFVRGIREADLISLKEISSKIRYGSLNGFDMDGGIAIGTRLANSLNVTVGDEITLVSPRGASTPFGTSPRVKRYPVRAVFEIGMPNYDTTVAFLPLGEAQKFLNVPNEVHVLEVLVDEPDKIESYQPELAKAAGPDMLLTDWRKRNADFYEVLAVENVVFFVVVTLVMLVAALNIVSSMVMLVKEKRRAIAILRTMGATQGSVMRIFFITGASIGIIGTFIGLLCGVLFCIYLEPIKEGLSWVSGFDNNNALIAYLKHMPAKLDALQVVGIIGMALGLSFLATLGPSWSAARLDPVEALRYE